MGRKEGRSSNKRGKRLKVFAVQWQQQLNGRAHLALMHKFECCCKRQKVDGEAVMHVLGTVG